MLFHFSGAVDYKQSLIIFPLFFLDYVSILYDNGEVLTERGDYKQRVFSARGTRLHHSRGVGDVVGLVAPQSNAAYTKCVVAAR